VWLRWQRGGFWGDAVASLDSECEGFGVRGRERSIEESEESRMPAILKSLLPISERSARMTDKLEAE